MVFVSLGKLFGGNSYYSEGARSCIDSEIQTVNLPFTYISFRSLEIFVL
jgi:hypothetical protein